MSRISIKKYFPGSRRSWRKIFVEEASRKLLICHWFYIVAQLQVYFAHWQGTQSFLERRDIGTPSSKIKRKQKTLKQYVPDQALLRHRDCASHVFPRLLHFSLFNRFALCDSFKYWGGGMSPAHRRPTSACQTVTRSDRLEFLTNKGIGRPTSWCRVMGQERHWVLLRCSHWF